METGWVAGGTFPATSAEAAAGMEEGRALPVPKLPGNGDAEL